MLSVEPGYDTVPADDAWRHWRSDRTHEGRAVAIGLAPETTIRTLGRVATLLECPLPLLVTTAEVAYPTEEGMSAGTGMVLAALASRLPIDPILCGKPSTNFLGAVQCVVSGRVLVVGDTVEADVELAAVAGWDSLLVLTGTSAADDRRPRSRDLRTQRPDRDHKPWPLGSPPSTRAARRPGNEDAR